MREREREREMVSLRHRGECWAGLAFASQSAAMDDGLTVFQSTNRRRWSVTAAAAARDQIADDDAVGKSARERDLRLS